MIVTPRPEDMMEQMSVTVLAMLASALHKAYAWFHAGKATVDDVDYYDEYFEGRALAFRV